MGANSFGERFCVTSFGESHGPGLGVVIDGCPSGVPINLIDLQRELDRRRPGGSQSEITSSRKEKDQVEILSGCYQSLTLGTPIAMLVRNVDAKSNEYAQIKQNFRRGHAEDLWKSKFGHLDHRGGGRSSGRETISRVMAGVVAKALVCHRFKKVNVVGFVQQLGPYQLLSAELKKLSSGKLSTNTIESYFGRFPSIKHEKLRDFLMDAKLAGESYGGVVRIIVKNVPKNLGQPVFHKLKADLASAFMGIGAVVSVEYGSGSSASNAKGTQFHSHVSKRNDQYGGIRGGLSTGENMDWQITFKPTSSILEIAKKGRHDPSIVIRAVPVCEAMVWIVLAEHILWCRTDKI